MGSFYPKPGWLLIATRRVSLPSACAPLFPHPNPKSCVFQRMLPPSWSAKTTARVFVVRACVFLSSSFFIFVRGTPAKDMLDGLSDEVAPTTRTCVSRVRRHTSNAFSSRYRRALSTTVAVCRGGGLRASRTYLRPYRIALFTTCLVQNEWLAIIILTFPRCASLSPQPPASCVPPFLSLPPAPFPKPPPRPRAAGQRKKLKPKYKKKQTI